MVYALWDVETNNLVAEYDTLNEALALALRGIDRNGPNDAGSLMLEVECEQGGVRTIAFGAKLVALAQRELPDFVVPSR